MAKKKTTKRGRKQKPAGNKARPRSVSKLDAKHERFAQEYVIDFDKARAYREAYPDCAKTSATPSASRLLQKVKIASYVVKLLDKQEKRAEKSADDIIRELEKLAFTNISDYLSIDDEGEVRGKSFDTIDIEKLAAIESIKQTTNITKNKDGSKEYETKNFQFKLYDKRAALVDLGKRFGLFPNKNEITGADGKPLGPITVILKHEKVQK